MFDYEIYITPNTDASQFILKVIINKEIIISGASYSNYVEAANTAEKILRDYRSSKI